MPRVEIRFDGVSRGLQSAAARSREEIKSVGNQADHSTKQASRGFRDAERNVGRFSRGALAGSGVMRGLGRSVAFASASFLGGVGLIAVLRQSITRASDLHEQINKVDVVFGASARGIRAWSKTSATAFGLARSEALQFVGTFGNLLTPMGIAPRLAAQMSKRLVELAGDMASFNNVSPEEVLQALNSGLTGMVRPLRRFGVFLDQNRISLEAVRSGIVKANVDMGKAGDAETKIAIARAKLADAQRKYGAGTTQVAAAQVTLHAAERALQTELAGRVPQLTAAQKAQASYNLILRDTANAQGDFKRTSGGLANQQRILRAELINLQEELGTALMPTVLRLTKRFTSYLQSLQEGGKRHEAFVRTMGQVHDVMKLVWAIVTRTARALNFAADAVGGWGNAFKLIIGGLLINKFLTLASAIRESRLALLVLGKQAVVTGTIVEAEEAGMAAGATATAGKIGGITAALRLLARRAAIPIIVTVLINEIIKRTTGFDPVGRAWGSAGFFADDASGERPVAGSRNPYPKGTPDWMAWNLGYRDSKKRHKGVGKTDAYQAGWKAGHGVADRTSGRSDRAAFIAMQASRAPGASSSSFHLPGEAAPYDCSAFVQAVYARAGIHIGRTTYQQVKQGRPVGRGELRAGDLIFMNFPGERSPGHVGIYVGKGYMVHDHGAHGGVAYQVVPWGSVVALRSFDMHGGPPITGDLGGAGAGDLGGGGGDLAVGSTRPASAKPDPTELRQSRARIGFIEGHLKSVLSPTLRRNLKRRADAIREALEHVQTEGDLRKLEARLKRLVHDYEEAVKLGRATSIVRASAKSLAAAINRLPDDMAKGLREKMAKIQKQLGDVTSQGQLDRLKAQLKKIQDAVAAAIEKLQVLVGQRRDAFGVAFGRVADKMLAVFDAKTQDLLDHARAQVAGFGFEIGVGEETPTERLLRQREDAKSAEDLARQVADAQEALQRAQAGGDAQTILDAQRALQEALYQQETAGLEARAAAERKAADEALAAEQKRIQGERDLLRERFANRIAEIETNLQNEVITAQQARDQLLALMADPQYQTDFGDAGQLLGDAFAVGMAEALDALTAALNALIDAINNLSHAGGGGDFDHVGGIWDWLQGGGFGGGGGQGVGGGGPHFASGGRVPGQWLGREDTIVGRLSAGEEVVDRSTSRALRAFLASGGHAGVGASYGPIYVFGTTKREVAAALADLTGPEFDRKIGYGASSASGFRGRPSTSGRP